MTGKLRLPSLFKGTFILVSCGALIHWTYVAVHKYMDQPISTYISYTKGDDGENIVFPHLTFCNYLFVREDQTLQGCKGQAKDFVPALQNCLKTTGFELQNYLEKIRFNMTDFLQFTYLSNGKKLDDLFYFKFDFNYGQCIGFDSEEMNLTLNDLQVQFYLKLNFSVLGQSLIYTSLHSKYDSPERQDIHPALWIRLLPDKKPDYHYVTLKKRIITRESTRNSPCGQFDGKTCQDIKGNEKIAKFFKCKVPFLYTGQHLDKFIEGYEDLPDCKEDILIDAIDVFLNSSIDCQKSIACQRTKFTEVVEKGPSDLSLQLTFADQEVEHYKTYISYDFQNLVCELGGLIGMTLGLSGISLGYFFASFFENH